jgi:hypothetical protein
MRRATDRLHIRTLGPLKREAVAWIAAHGGATVAEQQAATRLHTTSIRLAPAGLPPYPIPGELSILVRLTTVSRTPTLSAPSHAGWRQPGFLRCDCIEAAALSVLG